MRSSHSFHCETQVTRLPEIGGVFIFLCFFSSAARKQPLPQKMTKYRGGQHDSDQAAPPRARLMPPRRRFAAVATKLLSTHPLLQLSHNNLSKKLLAPGNIDKQEKKIHQPPSGKEEEKKKNSTKRGRDRKEEKSGGGGDVLVFASPIMFLMYKVQINV